MGAHADLARRWFDEVWNQKRDATIDELLGPGAEGWLADDREIRSAADFKAAWRQLLQAFPDLHVTVDDVIEAGDTVAVRWTAKGMHGGSGLGIPPTFGTVSFRGMTWIEIRDGQIVRGWDSWNIGGLLQHLSAPQTSH